jgi:hypothetical protein
MFSSDLHSTDPGPLDGPLTVESVRQWRAAVQAFFSDEWEQLRSMALKLEEECWETPAEAVRPLPLEAGRGAAGAAKPPAGGSRPQLAEEAARIPANCGPQPSVHSSRLAELARNIEECIQRAGDSGAATGRTG